MGLLRTEEWTGPGPFNLLEERPEKTAVSGPVRTRKHLVGLWHLPVSLIALSSRKVSSNVFGFGQISLALGYLLHC